MTCFIANCFFTPFLAAGADFRSVDKAEMVPALLLDDGTVLTEVIGAYVYLDVPYSEKPLLGTTALVRPWVFSWGHFLSNTCVSAVADILRNSGSALAVRVPLGPLELPQIPELLERGKMRPT